MIAASPGTPLYSGASAPLAHEVRLVADRTGKNLRYTAIDARPKLLASELSPPEGTAR